MLTGGLCPRDEFDCTNLCTKTPARSEFLSTKASINSSREKWIASFWCSEQRPPVNKDYICYSQWLTVVDRFDCILYYYDETPLHLTFKCSTLYWHKGNLNHYLFHKPCMFHYWHTRLCHDCFWSLKEHQ